MPNVNFERRGGGEPLLLVHGIGSRWQMWEPVMDQLAQQFDVIAVDVPGFAGSPRPPAGTPTGVPSMCALLEGFLTDHGIEKPHVAGNSMGGWIALELAKRGSVRSANGISPAGFHNRAERIYEAALLTSVRASARMSRPLAPWVLASASGRRTTLSWAMAHPERLTVEQVLGDLDGLIGASWFEPTLKWLVSHAFTGGDLITVPVTITWGEKDRLLLPQQASRALNAIPNARFVHLRDCGHIPTFDDPEQVARAIIEGTAGA